MIEVLEAVFENGVFVPATKPQLEEHQRVKLIVETGPASKQTPDPGVIERRRHNRIVIDPELSQYIASAPELLPEEM